MRPKLTCGISRPSINTMMRSMSPPRNTGSAWIWRITSEPTRMISASGASRVCAATRVGVSRAVPAIPRVASAPKLSKATRREAEGWAIKKLACFIAGIVQCLGRTKRVAGAAFAFACICYGAAPGAGADGTDGAGAACAASSSGNSSVWICAARRCKKASRMKL